MAKRTSWIVAAIGFGLAVAGGQAVAGNGTGKVGSILTGRLGYQVFVQLLNPSYTNYACGTPSTSWTFAFTTQSQGSASGGAPSQERHSMRRKPTRRWRTSCSTPSVSKSVMVSS